jgi:3-hydroxybutyryl-CoA dehydrogenase
MLQLEKIIVCGAGTMGSGIALVCAKAGYSTLLYDVSDQMIAKSQAQNNSQLEKWVLKNTLSNEAAQAIADRLHYSTAIEACTGDLAIEAIIENQAAKMQLFQALLEQNPGGILLASNTSSLSINALSSALPKGSRLVGLHFFNPATLMPLVEIIGGETLLPHESAALMAWVKTLGKTPVGCKDSPGFIVNRVARPYYLTAMRLVENQLAPPEQIDAVLEAAGFKMGPFKLMDLIGLDINYAVSQQVWQALGEPERLKPSALQAEKVKAGKLGRKSGEGFYAY